MIKTNLIEALKTIFDLSSINWDNCNKRAISSKLIEVINYYNNNPKLGLPEIARDCRISMQTLYEYLYTGEKLGICKFVRNDPNRIKNSKPIAMYDSNMNLVGIYKSGKQISKSFPDLAFDHRWIRYCATENKRYKGYIFRFATYEEYQQAC